MPSVSGKYCLREERGSGLLSMPPSAKTHKKTKKQGRKVWEVVVTVVEAGQNGSGKHLGNWRGMESRRKGKKRKKKGSGGVQHKKKGGAIERRDSLKTRKQTSRAKREKRAGGRSWKGQAVS